jgi:hypothetical protein
MEKIQKTQREKERRSRNGERKDREMAEDREENKKRVIWEGRSMRTEKGKRYKREQERKRK